MLFRSRPFCRQPRKSTPSSTPKTEPEPPVSATPPSNTAVSTVSSKPAPEVPATTLSSTDALIAPAPGEPFKGGNIYNGRGLRETLATTAPIGGTHTFVIRIQNDGSNRDTFVVDSTRDVHGFSLTFRSGGVNVTARMLAGTYRIEDLRPGRSVSITAKVTVWGSQAPGKAHLWRVSAVAPSNLTTADAVRFKVAARRRA